MRLALAALLLLAAPVAAADQVPSAGISLAGPDGKSLGSATLREGPAGIVLGVDATGLTPGWHGMHLHMVGDCSDGSGGFKKSGSHVGHDMGKMHGLLNAQGPETGDLPNLFADASGAAKGEFFLAGIKLADLQDADGTALIIHASPDDYTSQPIGGAGDRVACGVVGK